MKKKSIYKFNKQNETKKGKKLKVKVTKSTTLANQIEEIHKSKGDLSTSCLRQCGCCRVACPQMNYSEAVNIIDYIWSNCSHEKKKDIILTCVKHFFSKSLIKPCPILDDKTCVAYNQRPLNCKLYGLWPTEDYEKRVERLSNILKIDKSQIPLNTQCQYVKRNNGQALSGKDIEEMFTQLDKVDLQILCNNDPSKREEWEHKIEKKWNYRTIHDWILLLFFGEDWLVHLTSFAIAAKPEAINDFVNVLNEKTIDVIVARGKNV